MIGIIDRALRWSNVVSPPVLKPLRPGLEAAADWIAQGHDATPDGGVAAYYDAKNKRWAASYPETTGYIIPTLYEYADLSGRAEFTERATRMAHWESDIQLEGGGVMAGHLDAPTVVPTIFNTGQVLFGWIAAYQRTGTLRFAASARAASDWLIHAQDNDGAWRRFGSPFSHSGLNVYNTRVAYGLALVGQVLDEPRYTQAACANIEWALTQSRTNGWFAHNDLEDDRRPLTHTIAYASRGVLEVGLLTETERYVAHARRVAHAVAAAQRLDGALPGRLDAFWKPAARWSCLTGNAQMAMIWLRLAETIDRDDSKWIDAAGRCIAFLQTQQNPWHRDPGARGAIGGSAPLSGQYMRHTYPNWAAKFYMDAVMRYLTLAE